MTFLITGHTQTYGILGYPVRHTFSPIMQNEAFRACGLHAVYLAFEVAPTHLETAVQGLRSLGIAGVNVTVPHKVGIMPYLDEVTLTAQHIGAVNTVRNDHGRLIGTNTDGLGFLRSLEELSGSPQGQCFGILGAGGSARAILVSLAEAGALEVLVVNRTLSKARELVQMFAPIFPGTHLEALTLEELQERPLDVLINTTTVGMKEPSSPADLACFQKIGAVVDIIYNPRQTRLLEQAAQLGLPTTNGLGMLLYQGCAAFEFWRQQPAPVEIMREALFRCLA